MNEWHKICHRKPIRHSYMMIANKNSFDSVERPKCIEKYQVSAICVYVTIPECCLSDNGALSLGYSVLQGPDNISCSRLEMGLKKASFGLCVCVLFLCSILLECTIQCEKAKLLLPTST